jgi:23S rRNA (adenine1618-N6)-methyltransferase
MKTLHPKNPHNQRYDFKVLCTTFPKLLEFVSLNQYGDESINFSDPKAVMALNQALLSHFYKVDNWSIPEGHLCPPIPGRADYIHYIAELLDLRSSKIGLDIGTGTGCIYPIIGANSYNMKFVATEISTQSIDSCKTIIQSNENLRNSVELRLQSSSENIFENIIKPDEVFDFTICNPPFHKSLEDASRGSQRKIRNLNRNKKKKGHEPETSKKNLNFGGKGSELWCPGGELRFIQTMIKESSDFKNNCNLFTTLVSNKEHLEPLNHLLEKAKASKIKVIQMHHGQKVSHILTWSFN